MKLVKKITAAATAMALSVSIMSIGASAVTDTKSGSLAGDPVSGSSTVDSTSGSSSTTISAICTANVTGTYSWVNISTLETDSATKNKGYLTTATVTFTAPSGCRSIKEEGSHSVTHLGQYWATTTTAVY